jgi:outer membrane protein insertion porin family
MTEVQGAYRIGLFWWIIATLLMSSCNTNKYLATDQTLLKKTKIVFKNEKIIQDKNSLQNELLTFVTTKPNSKLLFFIPKEYVYVTNTGNDKNKWYHKAIRSLGEPPMIFDEVAAKKIAANMENHLKFNKGYYEAKVDFFTEEMLKGFTNTKGTDIWFTTEVTYVVSPGQRYTIKDITYDALDKNILSFVTSKKENAFIKKGDFIDYNLFELEKSRLTIELQNSGYTNFSNNYFEISGDSSFHNKEVEIFIEIRSPLPDTLHSRFTTGNINVYTDYYKDQHQESLTTDSLNGVSFFRQSTDFLVKPSLIKNAIFFKEGQLLSRDDRQKTFRKLNGLGTYRFVTINSKPNGIQDSILNFDILLTPYEKKWIWDGALQAYFSTLGAAQLLGFSASSQFVNRNLLGGSEKYSLRAELGTEVGFGGAEGIVRRTTNLSIQNNLNLPSFQDFIGLGKFASRVGIIKKKFYKSFVEDASTNIGLGFSANNIINFYSLSSFNASFGFDYTSPKNNRYIFKPLGFNLDLYDIKDSSRFVPTTLIQLQDVLSTGFLFRDFSFIYNKAKNIKGQSLLLINNFELSGWEVHLSNLLYNKIAGREEVWSLDNIAFAKYARYEFDGRFNKEYSKTKSFATRLNLGIVIPFGDIKVAPFVRQFGVGGPNSLRAWNVKQPGPGSYRNPADTVSTIFVNQGDFKIELNAEYRFKMIGVFDGAFFIDAGNVWTLRDDVDRPGALFRTNEFLSQMAIGVGYGLRFNFDFFIIRFDFGYKIRSPFIKESNNSNWYTFKEIRQQGLGNLQVGVNYPF